VSSSDPRPTFRALKEALRAKGYSWSKEQIFPNDDLSVGIFRGIGTFAYADYADDELIEPETIDNICRSLGVDHSDLSVSCPDGREVSVRPAPVMPKGTTPAALIPRGGPGGSRPPEHN